MTRFSITKLDPWVLNLLDRTVQIWQVIGETSSSNFDSVVDVQPNCAHACTCELMEDCVQGAVLHVAGL
jgi:hypothetical protein